MTAQFDIIVAGLGATGSAALHHTAKRGARVAGFDAFSPPHAQGSSHGETRMIREAYYEDPCYVPLVRRAYELWHELASIAGETLIVETGGVFAGLPDWELIRGLRQSAREYSIRARNLSAHEYAGDYPWLRPGDGMEVDVEPRAGFLHPERCIAAHLRAAAAAGASIHTEEPVRAWRSRGGIVEIETPRDRYQASRLVLSTGAWMTDALASAGVQATVTRQPLFWFRPNPARATDGPRCVWAIEFTPGKLLYGFPDVGSGYKAAIHYGGVATTAEGVDRTATGDEAREVGELLARYLPGVVGDCSKSAVCMYTNSPDLHFVIDAHPDYPNVFLASACSGHGFKFASAVGEAAAQWALDGAPRLDLTPFSLRRFSE